MKILLILLFPVIALSAPFVVSDPTDQTLAADISYCGVKLDTKYSLLPVTKTTDGKPFCRYNLNLVSNGCHVISMSYVINNALWGRLESAFSTPLDFCKPDKPDGIPLNLRVIK